MDVRRQDGAKRCAGRAPASVFLLSYAVVVVVVADVPARTAHLRATRVVREDLDCQVNADEGMMMGDREDGKRCVSLFLSFCLPYMGREETAWLSAPPPFFVRGKRGFAAPPFPDTRAQRTATSLDSVYVLIFCCCSARSLRPLVLRFAFYVRAVARILSWHPLWTGEFVRR